MRFPLSITFFLWRQISRPRALSAVMEQVIERSPVFAPLRRLGLLALLVVPVCGLSLSSPFTPASLMIAFLFPPFIMFFLSGTILGMAWSINIAQALNRGHRSIPEDLLFITPNGTLGFEWNLMLGVLHRNGRILWQFHRLVRRLTIVAIATTLAVLFLLEWIITTSSIAFHRESLAGLQDNILSIALVLLIVLFEHIQSLVMASLAPLAINAITRDGLLAPLMTGMMFLIYQIGTLLLTLVLCFMIFFWFGPTSLYFIAQTNIAWFGIIALIFYLIRETFICVTLQFYLWRRQVSIGEWLPILQGDEQAHTTASPLQT